MQEESHLASLDTAFCTKQFQHEQHALYGLLWMLCLISQFLGIASTCIYLGYLLDHPARVNFMFVCNMGPWVGVTVFLLLLSTFTSFVAKGYSLWLIFGRTVGIFCINVGILAVTLGIRSSTALRKASTAPRDPT
jgi:hypothetical protein